MGAIQDTVYNNYLTAYTPKDLTRYDTHKKSELRKVYNSIVELNKESPWYLPTTNKDTQHYAVDLKENAHQLHNTIAQLGVLDNEELFQKKSAYASDDSVADVGYVGNGESVATDTTYELKVQSIASGQENLGKFLANEPIGLRPSTYSFDVAVNDMNYEFQFTISEDETNREVQERLSRLINSSGVGIKVSIEEADGKTALKLISESKGITKGKSELFSISDDNTSKNSGTVDYFGLDYITKRAANAQFTVDGESYSASSNRFTLGKVFDVELKGVSPDDEPTVIGLKTDIESLTDNIAGLLKGYNDFLDNASAYLESQSKSKQLINEMKGIARHFHSSMESIGVDYNEDGKLTMNKKVLQQAAMESNNLSETFGCLKDFSQALMAKSNQVSLNPMDYVEKTIVAYKNPGHNFASPYTMSAYSGMMFNGYC